MKIICKRDSLYKGFQTLNGIIAGTTTKPILQNVRFEINDDCIELFATDLEVGIRYFIPIEDRNNVEKGILLIPQSKTENVLKEWIGDDVKISSEKSMLNIAGTDSNYSVNCDNDIEQFPSCPQFDDEGVLEVDPYLISQMIRRTVFIVMTEKIRYALSGVYMGINENGIEMVTTDTRRLSRVSKKIENPLNINGSCIIPAKGLMQLDKIISSNLQKKDTEKLKIKIDGRRVMFRAHNFIMSVQLIEGKYPDCSMFIPDNGPIKIDVDTQRFISAVRRASIVTTDDSKLVKFIFCKGKLVLNAVVAEVGSSTVKMDIDYDGELFEICFNPDFIKDAINVIGSDTITMELTEQGRGGVIKEMLSNYPSGDNGKFIHVIMPINLED